MADVFVLPKDIGIKDCSDIQPWDRKSLRYDYILKATTGDADYPIQDEVGICTNLWVHGNAQIDNIQINQTITGNPTSYLGDVTAANINSADINANGTVTANYFIGDGSGLFNIPQASVSGLSGINTSGTSTFTDLIAQQINVSGIITATSFIGNGSQLTGIAASSIIGVTSYAINAGTSTSVMGGIASVTSLNVSGISTLGVTTTTNLAAQQLIVSGISTVGLGSTAVPPSNSQMSFFLLNDTTLRIAARGNDGILRFANITLA